MLPGRLENNQSRYDYYKHYKLSYPEASYNTGGIVGLKNLGNTCYFNSILQCLGYTFTLTDYLLTNQVIRDQRSREQLFINQNFTFFQRSFTDTLVKMWTYNMVVNPYKLLKHFKNIHPYFDNGDHHDSHEALVLVLDTLHKACKYNVKMFIRQTAEATTTTTSGPEQKMVDAYNEWIDFYGKDYSKIIETFNGLVLSNTGKFEPFGITSLPIRSSKSSLQDLLADHYQSSKLWIIPDIFIVSLKRFNSDGTKNNNLVTYPLNLDLGEYVSKDKADQSVYKYVLYAINYHSGTVNKGHYWSSCKSMLDKWYTFDDEDAHKVSEFDKHSLISEHAYILFYHRLKIL